MIGKGEGQGDQTKARQAPQKKGDCQKIAWRILGVLSMVSLCHFFSTVFLRQIVFCMSSTSCFFHVASSLLHFGSRFFFVAAVFRSRFPQPFSFGSRPYLSCGFVSVVLTVFSPC